MQGFIIFDYAKQYNAARKELSQWLSEGKIQRKETIVKGGLEKADRTLLDLYAGKNTGESRPVRFACCRADLITSGKLLLEVGTETGSAKGKASL